MIIKKIGIYLEILQKKKISLSKYIILYFLWFFVYSSLKNIKKINVSLNKLKNKERFEKK